MCACAHEYMHGKYNPVDLPSWALYMDSLRFGHLLSVPDGHGLPLYPI